MLKCPDCDTELVKSWIECEDGSGWYCGWLCDCQREKPEIDLENVVAWKNKAKRRN